MSHSVPGEHYLSFLFYEHKCMFMKHFTVTTDLHTQICQIATTQRYKIWVILSKLSLVFAIGVIAQIISKPYFPNYINKVQSIILRSTVSTCDAVTNHFTTKKAINTYIFYFIKRNKYGFLIESALKNN